MGSAADAGSHCCWLLLQVPGLTYAMSSAETLSNATNRSGTGREGSQTTPNGLSVRQEQVVGNLMRIKALVRHHVAQVRAAAAPGSRPCILLPTGWRGR
jgi:hypothetical protein